MKKFKKATAFLLAAVMVLAMNCTALAAGSLPNPDKPESAEASLEGHTFKAYQIFKGDQSEEEGDNVLLKIDWGDGIQASNFLNALKNSKEFGTENPFTAITYDENATNKSADAVARVVTEWAADGKEARAFARLADQYKTETSYASVGEQLSAGYYLVVDETNVNEVEGGVKNLSILQMTKAHPFTPENKTDVPEMEKKVKEINDSDIEVQDKWGDVADYDINDDVEFILTGTLPSDYDSYVKYKYVFHDTLSAALSLNTNSIKVTIDNKDATGYKFAQEGQSFSIAFDDLKTNEAVTKDSVIRVEYSAKLTATDVKYGGDGNENTAYVEYSNNPNDNGTGTPSTGKTPDDKVVVFTYQLIANKKDEDGNDLKGAGFTLYKLNKNSTAEDKYEAVGNEITGVDIVKFEFKGIDAGDYKLVETTVPSGYNKAEDMFFKIESTIDEETQSVTELKITQVTGVDGKVITDATGEAVFTFTGKLEDGSLSTDIENLKGILLPSTGGIGTTIFYVIGAILVVGAGVLLIVKKRMSKAE